LLLQGVTQILRLLLGKNGEFAYLLVPFRFLLFKHGVKFFLTGFNRGGFRFPFIAVGFKLILNFAEFGFYRILYGFYFFLKIDLDKAQPLLRLLAQFGKRCVFGLAGAAARPVERLQHNFIKLFFGLLDSFFLIADPVVNGFGVGFQC